MGGEGHQHARTMDLAKGELVGPGRIRWSGPPPGARSVGGLHPGHLIHHSEPPVRAPRVQVVVWTLCSGLTSAGAIMAGEWLPTAWALAIGTGIATIVGGIASRAASSADQSRQSQGQQRYSQTAEVQMPRVRTMKDPVALGVHPSEPLNPDGDEVPRGLPPHIPRDVDARVCKLLRLNGFVLLVGESTAGKTKCAYQAVHTVLRNRRLAAPHDRDSLAAVVARLRGRERVVLWLDDLERFLGANGLTVGTVKALLAKGVTIVATMRRSEYDRFGPRAEPPFTAPDRPVWRAGRDVVHLACMVTVERLWSDRDLNEAERFAADPRIAKALRQKASFGVAETLAAGPELIREWRSAWAVGTRPRGAALVTATVDARRAGLDGPLRRGVIEELHTPYLELRGGQALRPETLDQAWEWALQPILGASSMLVPAGSLHEEDQYLPFDYLVDRHTDPIPLQTWLGLLAHVDQSTATRIAGIAFWHDRPAFHAAVQRGLVTDVLSRASAAADRENYAGAIRLLEAAERARCGATSYSWFDEVVLRHHIAFYKLRAGEVEDADKLFRALLAEAERIVPAEDEYLRVVRHNLASCARFRGDLDSAIAQFRTLLADRERLLGPDALHTLITRAAIAEITAQMGDYTNAYTFTQEALADSARALGRNHTHTLSLRRSAALRLAQVGDKHAALDALNALLPDIERTLGGEHADVRAVRTDIQRIWQGDPGHPPLPADQPYRVTLGQRIPPERPGGEGRGDEGGDVGHAPEPASGPVDWDRHWKETIHGS
jgi:eukaryotic-like serine/threonine-protein kinase